MMRPPRSQASKDRERLITRETELHDYRINKAQKKLASMIAAILAGFATDETGAIIRGPETYSLGAQIDRLYDDFSKEYLEPIATRMTAGFERIAAANDKYFASVKDNDASGSVRSTVFGALGITGGALGVGSLLLNILQDREAINVIKSTILSAVFGGITVTALKITVEQIITRQDGGILKKLFDKTAPDSFVKMDRFTANTYAKELELQYAIYQGGIIGTTRPFCLERNNRVFSREEIARFGTPSDEYGGYTNKTTGEFQGKPKIYNPFTDCGGYNCRHQLDYISDELAKALRPNLRP